MHLVYLGSLTDLVHQLSLEFPENQQVQFLQYHLECLLVLLVLRAPVDLENQMDQ